MQIEELFMLQQQLSGKFITFEGIEGTGKTTIISFFSEYLREQEVDLVTTREPGGTTLGNEVRQIFLNHRDENVSGEVETLLLFASRRHHLEKVVLPNLKDGKCVICDRFTDSSYAYQGFGRGVPKQSIAMLENMVQNEFRPNLVFIMDAPAELGIQRARGRGQLDRVEASDREFFEKSRTGFLERAKQDPSKYIVIDTTKPLVDVREQVVSKFEQWLKINK